MERVITIKEEAVYQEDYQMRMLTANEIGHLLPVRGRGMDGCSCYDYDVSGKISMQALYERAKMSRQDLRQFLLQLREAVKEVEQYLLHVEAILLKPEYLFYEEGTFYFCYYPPAGEDFWKRFHGLTEYLVKRADYQDQDCAKMILYLHKETMKENYSLEKVIEGCLAIETGPDPAGEADNSLTDAGRAEDDVRPGDSLPDPAGPFSAGGRIKKRRGSSEPDWDAVQAEGDSVMKETDHMWTPMKRFLNRKKKQKWGDWDGLYIEEEELK